MLNDAKIEFQAYELDLESDGDEIQGALRDLTGQSTVPNIFINGQLLGGSDDLISAKENGNLSKLLYSVNITNDL